MIPTYKEYDTTTIADMRFYQIDDKLYPSVTTVLGTTGSEEKKQSLKNWRTSLGASKADAITQEACRRGTAVHLLSERYLKKEQLVQKPNEFQPGDLAMFNGLKLKLNSIDEIWGQEVVLYSNLLEIAGRCDLISKYKKKLSIVDFKTTRRMKTKNEIEDYKHQLAAYSIMHNEMFGTDITQGVILMVSDQGFPLEFIFELEEFYEPLVLRIEKFYDELEGKLNGR